MPKQRFRADANAPPPPLVAFPRGLQVARKPAAAPHTTGPDDWAERAACNVEGVDPDWFYPDYGDGEAPSTPGHGQRISRLDEAILRAKLICSGCPVRDRCLQEGIDEEFGVWGGLTARDRDRYRETGELPGPSRYRQPGPQWNPLVLSFVQGVPVNTLIEQHKTTRQYAVSILRASVV